MSIKRFKAREIDRSLQRKGFIKIEKNHHTYYIYVKDGKETPVRTYLSHGANELSKIILKRIAKELMFDDYETFSDLIECPLKREAYEAILKSKNKI